MSTREQLHQMVDLIPDDELKVAHRLLERLRDTPQDDPVLQTLVTAPEDPESLTADEEAALDRAIDEARRGETKPWAEVRSRIG